jgi:hypothetical protein
MIQKRHFYSYLLGAALLLLIGVGISFVANHRTGQKTFQQELVQTPATSVPTIPPHAIATGDGSYAMPTSISGQMKFVSPKLGISFLYTKQFAGGPLNMIKEERNRIYVYADVHYPEYDYHRDGQFIEAFAKSPNDTLEEAIQKTVLKGYSEKDCFAVSVTEPTQKNSEFYYPHNYVLAYISFPGNTGGDEVQPEEAKCPNGYVAKGGVFYFIMDSKNPNRFAFLKIGQSGPVWQKPIQFISQY